MLTPTRPHHQVIWEILKGFDSGFLAQNNILFGGGTRIALELGEYRESVDIDLFCVGKDAYRAARSSITQNSFGALFRPDCEPALFKGREIRADRDAIRSILDGAGRPIKLEIIHFDSDDITGDADNSLFPLSVVSRESCFTTKLLANADRYRDGLKDIVDLLMMRECWGDVGEQAWQSAYQQYGEQVVLQSLASALQKLMEDPPATQARMAEEMKIQQPLAKRLTTNMPRSWLDSRRLAP
ncbi:nucleotidyl transferase AbiEii/AbiGii toxin family protein [Alcanivorax sp. S6407]|uniref:nucleotidyl transferase AbiEii/AbiGii toxin family protein n=1 Tax=Alcanivorax sp. S6407 TaxID=2926424 RepID=UPI001FF63C12|nr:nucleotidyl transferase AbiEii/AbiGii toxin family protein [Alcanivorax sp. S6407]MCK0152561.1 nucleotidyl transferase AbiEii/AbiGii toxin family protein [Alcanivorax sp. S6407]